MNVIGIIAEYNPFHNGHLLQLNQCKTLADADYSIVVLGGDFLQRGEPSMFSKYARTQMALAAGADLVVELPCFASCGSASYFAGGGISLLKHTGITTHLGFGSESGDINAMIEKATNKLQAADDLQLSHDYNYARSMAQQLSLSNDKATPNDILGIEYVAAIMSQKASLQPLTISRKGDDYHDAVFSDAVYGSATAIRQYLISGQPDALSQIMCYLPSSSSELIRQYIAQMPLVRSDDFYPLMRYALFNCDDPSHIYDIPMALANRLKQYQTQYAVSEAWIHALKSRNYTYTHIQRALTHLMLGLTKIQLADYLDEDQAPYIRILGFRKEAAPLLKQLKSHCDKPIISKMADASSYLSDRQYMLLKQNIKSARIYKTVLQTQARCLIRDEVQESPVIF